MWTHNFRNHLLPLTASTLPLGPVIRHLAGARRMALATLGFYPWGGD